MTQEIISGLHSCKPGNEPVIGQVKTFTVEQKTGKSGKAYLKIKSASAENGGQPYRILEATPTGFTDSYGNISFNIGIERMSQNGGEATCRNATTESKSEPTANNANQRSVVSNAAQQVQAPSAATDRSHRIERQHSQEMALRCLELQGGPYNNQERLVREWTDWFQLDLDNLPRVPSDNQRVTGQQETEESIVPF